MTSTHTRTFKQGLRFGLAALVVALAPLIAPTGPAEAADATLSQSTSVCHIAHGVSGNRVGSKVVYNVSIDCDDRSGYRIWTKQVLKKNGSVNAFHYENTYDGTYFKSLTSEGSCSKGSVWQGTLTVRTYSKATGKIMTSWFYTTGVPKALCG